MPHRPALSVLSVLLVLVVPAAAAAHTRDGRTVTMQDRCDPVTFNAAFGPGTCVADGGVSLGDFIGAFPAGGHPGWNFSPTALALDSGRRLRARDEGGETHSFTEVVAFGATPLVDFAILNNALPPGTPPAVPIGNLNFVGAGRKLDIRGLSTGTHRFECLIHPWMRTTVTVAPGPEDDN